MAEELSSCVDCPAHQIIKDPDPTDWFNDDDVAVVCTETEHANRNPGSRYHADRSPHRPVAVGCRPFYAEREAQVPKWCPRGNTRSPAKDEEAA